MTNDEMLEKMYKAYESIRGEVCYRPSMDAALDSIMPEIERLRRQNKILSIEVASYIKQIDTMKEEQNTDFGKYMDKIYKW